VLCSLFRADLSCVVLYHYYYQKHVYMSYIIHLKNPVVMIIIPILKQKNPVIMVIVPGSLFFYLFLFV